MNKNFMNNNVIVRHAPLAVLLVGTVVALTACGGQTAVEAGEELIAGELATAIGFGPLADAACEDPAEEAAGETFTCTAATEAGDTLEFAAILRSDDEIFVAASNVIFADDLDFLENDAVQVTAGNFEVDPSTLSVDCPDENTLIVDDRVICQITDASDGGVYDLTVTLEPYVVDEGFPGWMYSLGDRKN